MHRHITWVIVAHALLRIAGGTSGILIGLYLAGLSNHGAHTSAALVGTLSAVSFAAELFASIPMGLASDAMQPRWLMAGGAVVGAFAAVLFAMSGSTAIFYVSRTLEGLGAAAVVPALLAYLADATEDRPTLRVRAMSYFELTLLAGLALGGIFAAQLFRALHAGAFAVVALVYLACAVILVFSVSGKMVRKLANPLADLRDVLRRPSLRHLAPVWLCVNAIVGLWLGPMLPFLLTKHAASNQYLAGIYASNPARVGWLLLGYALVFGAGITAWSFVLPHVRLKTAMNITLATMLPVCAGIYLLNHSAHQPAAIRWIVGGVTALMIMVESGFTPAALAWLAQALPIEAGRGAAMGIYSVLLSIGAILGSLLAALLGQLYSIDGLLVGTVLVAVTALVFLRWVPSLQPSELENA
ncbi:MAG TPA: MFS transporter [Candidatus Baltobacteraceae bacterium]|nr:MFS transporter [Candidatus Baltobacteraceae bacterium]